MTASVQPRLDVIEYFAGRVELATKNTDPDNWEWEDASKPGWDVALEYWQDFRAKWYGNTASPLDDPLKCPSLSLEPLHENYNSSMPSIVVRESYVPMFDHLWAQAMAFDGGTGAIITGQSGIGKTSFQYYLLVRLLQRKQVVLFSPDCRLLYLFYHDKVYNARATLLDGMDPMLRFPVPKSRDSKVFIWSLFDTRGRDVPMDLLVYRPCLPVQTVSPNPERYRTWEKELHPLLTGLPLWTREELTQGLPYQDRYHSLMKALRKVHEGIPQDQMDPLLRFPGVRALLEECEEGTLSMSPKDAFECLLEAAIDHFGYAAREVFHAVFNFQPNTYRRAFMIKLADLQDMVYTHPMYQTTDYSWILARSPVYKDPFTMINWTVNFKSDWVTRDMIRGLDETDNISICKGIKFFRRTEHAEGMAKRFLEPLAHRSITETSTGGFWPLINMVSNDADPPQFTVVEGTPSPVPDDSGAQFAKIPRSIIKFRSIGDLSLYDKMYYMPKDPSFSLFDAFTVDLDYSTKSATLWLLQMTASRMHGGSPTGYQNVRDIVAKLKDCLAENPPPRKTMKVATGQASSTPLVQVRYLLIVPRGDSLDKWQFPKGWNRNCSRNDHRGDVYCLEVPVAVSDI